MKKLIKAILIIICSIPSVGNALAYTQYPAKKSPSIRLELIVPDSNMLKGAEIQFEMCKDGLNSRYLPGVLHTFKISAKSTVLSIPLTTSMNYGRILFTYGKRRHEPFSSGDNLFIFQDGDDFSLTLGKTKATFKGKGSVKYNYLKNFSDLEAGAIRGNAEIDSLYRNRLYEQMIKAQRSQIDSTYSQLSLMLTACRDSMNIEIYNQIKIDNWARENWKFLGLLNGRAIGHRDPNYDLVFANVFKQFFNDFHDENIEPKLLLNSYYHADFLYQKAKWSAIIASNPSLRTSNSYKFEFLQNDLNKNFGLIKDKASLIAFNREYKIKPETRGAIKETTDKMEDSKYRTALLVLEKALLGSAYEFALPDATGNIRKLSEFRGKLVILDFWYTGCMGCIGLAEAMKPIISSYKDNPNVQFISISIDGAKKKDTWLKSLADEIYSSKDEVNLLAVEGKDSEIIKFYNILSYPTLFVISRNGNIITTAPPRPFSDKPETTVLFKDLIDKNL